MAVETVVVQGYADGTASNTQDFTSSGFGTPDAALIYYAHADYVTHTNAAAGGSSRAGIGMGFWDGTNQATASMASANYGTADSNWSGRHASKAVIWASGTSNSFEASVTNITDGIRLTTDTAGWSANYGVTVVLFKGLTNAKVGNFAGGSMPRNITTVGFKPDLVFISASLASTNSSATGSAYNGLLCLGVIHNSSTDTVTQGCYGFGVSQTFSPNNNDIIRNAAGASRVTNVETESVYYSLGSFDSQGFTVSATGSQTNQFYFNYLAIELDDPDDAKIVFDDAATSTGTEANTNIGFEPQLLGVIGCQLTSYNSLSDGTGLSVGITDGTTQTAMAYCLDHGNGADPQPAKCYHYDDTFYHIRNPDNTQEAEADYDSFDTNGFTLDWTDASPSAYKNIYWAIKSSSSAPTLSAPTVTNITSSTATVGCTVTF